MMNSVWYCLLAGLIVILIIIMIITIFTCMLIPMNMYIFTRMFMNMADISILTLTADWRISLTSSMNIWICRTKSEQM